MCVVFKLTHVSFRGTVPLTSLTKRKSKFQLPRVWNSSWVMRPTDLIAHEH
jgi:hypothetical protein